jgi:acetyl-CoA carboxylase carboxyl transferase subunit beta
VSWLKKLMPSRIRTEGGNKRSVPEGLWEKCDKCGSVLYPPRARGKPRGLPEVQATTCPSAPARG